MAPGRLWLLPSFNAIRLWRRPLVTVARPSVSFYSVPKRRAIVMANVTSANFWESKEQLEKHLRAADFVALDFEMTGVETTPWRRHSEIDTCETRYQHLKHSAESFAVWQCGVCPFKWDETGNKFIAYPYNFFIFPRNELPVEMESRSYFCQTSSLEFLAKHHFDFNTTVYNGMSYLSFEQEEIARAKLGLTEEARKLKRLNLENESEIPLTKTSDVVFSERLRVQLGQWRDGLLRNKKLGKGTDPGVGGSDDSGVDSMRPAGLKASVETMETKFDIAGLQNPAKEGPTGNEVRSLRPTYLVDIFGNNQARLVKQVLRKHFQDLVPEIIAKPNSVNGKQVSIIFTTSKEDRAKLEEELEEENRRHVEDILSKAVGFRKIIDAIIAAGKPLVGHNCLLDLAHLHDKFLGPLPSSLEGFSASIRQHFPCVLDTKYLLKTEPTLRDVNGNRSTSLAIVYQELCQGFPDKAGIPERFYNGKPRLHGKPLSKVSVEIGSELQRYPGGGDTGLKHEAGFDAYMTGALFAQLCHILQVDIAVIRSLPQVAMAQHMGFASYANLLMLQTFRGQLALDLNTGGEAIGIKAPRGPTAPPYRLPDRQNVALFWGLLPSQDQEQFLRKIVQNVFAKDRRSANIDVYSVDASSAFVEFKSSAILEAFFQAVQNALVATTTSSSVAIVFAIKAARFEAYERICKSPLATKTLGMAADLLGLNQLDPSLFQNYNRKFENAHSSLDQRLTKPKDEDQKVDESGFGVTTFEVGSWKEPMDSLPMEQVVVGKSDNEDILAEREDSVEFTGNLTTEQSTSRDKMKSRRELKSGVDMKDDAGKDNLGFESSYAKWMKRVFIEDDSSPSGVASPVTLRLPKRPRPG